MDARVLKDIPQEMADRYVLVSSAGHLFFFFFFFWMEVVSHLLFEAPQEDHCSVADCCCRNGESRVEKRSEVGSGNEKCGWITWACLANAAMGQRAGLGACVREFCTMIGMQ